ncbi:MAG: HAMP domain-containing protein [Deltaproteobacteria bacterium]|nr:HAMP domain-containing protein [Deltaproteobacteria bacterium]
MTHFVLVAAGAIGLIVFVSFVAARLLRARTAGLSVRMQIFLALACIVGAFAFGLGVLVLDRIKARAALLGREAALDEAHAIAALVSAEMTTRPATLAQVAERLRRGRGEQQGVELHLALLDAQGRPVFASGRSPDEDGTVAAFAPVRVRGQIVGQVRVVKPTLLIRKTLADFAPTVLVISLVLGAVAAASAAVIGRTIAAPIEALTSFAERVSAGDRRAAPPPGHGREVKRLSGALDSMRRELEGRPFVEAFAADLSHELKNPVAAIRASAEVLRDGAQDEPGQAAHFLGRILDATGRIEALLGDLLSLARVEARGVENAEPVDLLAQAQAVAEAVRELGASVEIRAEGSLVVRGDAAWLGRAIRNLVDNARLHGTPGQPIEIALGRQEGEVCCRVANGGQISPHVHKRIFKRFVTSRGERGGTGLGLAIVRAVALAHGGRAECLTPGPPRVEFQLSLPAA